MKLYNKSVEKKQPNFLIIGAMKCATTSLCAYLRQHPDIFVADPKDIYFFSNDEFYEKGWEWYVIKFQGVTDEKAIGEGTDNYSKQYEFPAAPSRINKHLPDAKLIYIVRNPVNQVMSTWVHLNVMNGLNTPFNKALLERKLFFDNCNYLKQINAYYDFFPKEKIQVCFFEDMIGDLQGFLANRFDFLEVDPTFHVPDLEARNTKERRFGDRLVTRGLRKIPCAQDLLGKSPSGIKNIFRPLFQWRHSKNPTWNKATANKFLEKLGEPTCEFLTQHGKAKDYWDIRNTLNKYGKPSHEFY